MAVQNMVDDALSASASLRQGAAMLRKSVDLTRKLNTGTTIALAPEDAEAIAGTLEANAELIVKLTTTLAKAMELTHDQSRTLHAILNPHQQPAQRNFLARMFHRLQRGP